MIIGQFEAKIGKHDIVYKEQFDAPYSEFPVDSSYVELIDLKSNSP